MNNPSNGKYWGEGDLFFGVRVRQKTFLRTAIWMPVAALMLAGWACAAATLTVSPNSISNTYAGTITLQIGGLTNTETVVMQKFLDTDASNVVDSSAILVQQFQLTDGQASVFTNGAILVTNSFTPGDTDGAANGSITAVLYPSLDFQQEYIGKYLFVLSSPVGHFTPQTNSLTVTNFPFGQMIKGNVVSNATTTVLPYSVITLVQMSGNNTTPVAGIVASNNGAFAIAVPPGTYSLLGFKTNYVSPFATAPAVTLGAGLTITTNISLTHATYTISGKAEDATTSAGLPGLGMFVQAADNSIITFAFTDTNGNFGASVTPYQWGVQANNNSLPLKGYNSPQNNINVDTTNGSVSGVTCPFQKGTAIFYGKVTDASGNPLTGAQIASSDTNNIYWTDGYTYTNGQYVTVAVGGLSDDPWYVQYDDGGPANYIYSQPALDQNNGTNLNVGQAVKQNFTGILATNVITGNVSYNGTNLVGVGVYATATVGSAYFNSYVDTDTNGNFVLPVANSNVWNVSLNCYGGNDNVEDALTSDNFNCPNSPNIAITNNNVVTNFVVQTCNGVQIQTTSPLPEGTNGSYYSIQFNAASCAGNFNWEVLDPQDVPSGLTLYSGGAFNGTPTSSGTFNFTVQVIDGDDNTATLPCSLTIVGGPLQITTTSPLPSGTVGTYYTQALQVVGGTPPYGGYVPNYSAPLPPGLTLDNGVISGTPTQVGTYYFDLVATDSVADVAEEDGVELIIESNQPPAALVITNISLSVGTNGVAYGAQLGATGGQPPYDWVLALGSAGLPPGLALASSGLISGTPTNNGQFYFQVQATDQYSDTTNKVLYITINTNNVVMVVIPVLSQPEWLSKHFTMRLTGVSNQNYTLQMSTNALGTNWLSLFVTNNPTANSFFVTDTNATNRQRFYRVVAP